MAARLRKGLCEDVSVNACSDSEHCNGQGLNGTRPSSCMLLVISLCSRSMAIAVLIHMSRNGCRPYPVCKSASTRTAPRICRDICCSHTDTAASLTRMQVLRNLHSRMSEVYPRRKLLYSTINAVQSIQLNHEYQYSLPMC